MLVSEISDKELCKICDRMKEEDPKLFLIFLERHPDIKVRYEKYKG